MIEQWGVVPAPRQATTISLGVSYTSSSSYSIVLGDTFGASLYNNVSASSFIVNIASRTDEIRWMTMGY